MHPFSHVPQSTDGDGGRTLMIAHKKLGMQRSAAGRGKILAEKIFPIQKLGVVCGGPYLRKIRVIKFHLSSPDYIPIKWGPDQQKPQSKYSRQGQYASCPGWFGACI